MRELLKLALNEDTEFTLQLAIFRERNSFGKKNCVKGRLRKHKRAEQVKSITRRSKDAMHLLILIRRKDFAMIYMYVSISALF